jgi:hypothetical protein
MLAAEFTPGHAFVSGGGDGGGGSAAAAVAAAAHEFKAGQPFVPGGGGGGGVQLHLLLNMEKVYVTVLIMIKKVTLSHPSHNSFEPATKMAANWTKMQTKPSWARTLHALNSSVDEFTTMVLEEFGSSGTAEEERFATALTTLDNASVQPTARNFGGYSCLACRKKARGKKPPRPTVIAPVHSLDTCVAPEHTRTHRPRC